MSQLLFSALIVAALLATICWAQLSEKPVESAHELAEEERTKSVEEKHWKAYREALAAEQRTKDELVKILSNTNMDAAAKQQAYHNAVEDSRKFAEEAQKRRAEAEDVHRREKRLREMREKMDASSKKEHAFTDTDLTLEDRVAYDAEVAHETQKRQLEAEKAAKVVDTDGQEVNKADEADSAAEDSAEL